VSENTEKALARMLFREREDDFARASYDREIAFYESIGSGNIDMMHFFESPLFSEGCGDEHVNFPSRQQRFVSLPSGKPLTVGGREPELSTKCR
jgi:hypothetical protein